MRKALVGAAYSALIAAALLALACAAYAASVARNQALAAATLVSSLSDLCDRVASVLAAALAEGGPEGLSCALSELRALANERWGVGLNVTLINGTEAGAGLSARVALSAGPYSVSRTYSLTPSAGWAPSSSALPGEETSSGTSPSGSTR